jgi:SAM-dependent methyltransferase
VLNRYGGNSSTSFVSDLSNGSGIPSDFFDCVVLTQTLHLVFDMPAAIANLHRALRPGGALLVTAPGITALDRVEFIDSWYWSLTAPALERLLSGPFQRRDVRVETFGNLYAATAFLHAAAVEEVSMRKLDEFDRAYPVIVAARAVKPAKH